MNAVWNSYGQLCGCPEIFKKSCKFFCRELDIRVPQIVYSYLFYATFFNSSLHFMLQIIFRNREQPVVLLQII